MSEPVIRRRTPAEVLRHIAQKLSSGQPPTELELKAYAMSLCAMALELEEK